MSFEYDGTPNTLGFLMSHELFWRDLRQWLESRGYMLRPRFRPTWVPSWLSTGKSAMLCEDSVHFLVGYYSSLIDATRLKDGSPVFLKRIDKFVPQFMAERDIGLYFSASPRAADPRNHCIPICEVLEIPHNNQYELIVMPRLREFISPRFDTFGEAVEFFRQIFEGIQFMHEHHCAHRDCQSVNIMMDATQLYPNGFHPARTDKNKDWKGKAKYSTRTRCNPKYFLIDFGLSRFYDPVRGDKTVPEFQGEGLQRLHDPFFTDIYYLGNMIRQEFIDVYYGFEFIEPLVTDMTTENPRRRPTSAEVITRFEEVRRSLGARKLRSRPRPRKEFGLVTFFRAFPHSVRRAGYILRGIPAVPVR
ncbi:kinase-like domain-containing protein [Mycena filopes]|nr:kinase-like domain-containing protein [Mycena filopes]